MLILRKKMPKVQRHVRNSQIRHRVIDFIQSNQVNTLFTYHSMGEEVDTREIIKYCLQRDITVALPKVDQGSMAFYKLDGLEDLEAGAYGIKEPKGEELLEPSKEDLILIPGVVFDRDCNRIGFGGGYYDRYLKSKHGVKMGLAYNYQIIQHIEVCDHDIPVDVVMTSNGLITRRK